MAILFAGYWFGCKPLAARYDRLLSFTSMRGHAMPDLLRGLIYSIAISRVGYILARIDYPKMWVEQRMMYRDHTPEQARQRRIFEFVFRISPNEHSPLAVQARVDVTLTNLAATVASHYPSQEETANPRPSRSSSDIDAELAQVRFERARLAAVSCGFKVDEDWQAHTAPIWRKLIAPA
jgi:hypothetical protein